MTEASFITTCVFNAFFSLTAITFNIVTILALRKPLTIPRAVKTLLMSQAVSDLGVGLLVQPLYVAWLVMQIQENTQIRTFEIISNLYGNIANLFTYASFFGVVALATDRFLAIHLHLRYQELVTHKRVFLTIDGVCYLTTALFYFKIYSAVRYHRNQIQVLEEQLAQNNGGDMENAARERKAAVGTFYVFLVFLICYLPNICFWIIQTSTGRSTVLWHFGLHSNTLMLLNSSLNPMIYCWKMRPVRHAIMEILRNILPNPHQ
ncbi:unnamed protein product [Porites lobata]|uniref:G-protein coupled receptors family 1 profile domain-containing protein n=1 Tax=Porites lobata TaxID=104759 RepID=A0ABN8MYQ9_9CNID|nr:unnamed protein product [Porites lobata]